MRKFVIGFFALWGIIVGAGLYLALWPVPIEPVVWNAPKNLGYVGAFAPNQDLAKLEKLSIGRTYGPEDMVSFETPGGVLIYASGHKGEILELNPTEKTHKVIAKTGGIPLGIEIGPDRVLYVADAHKGLLSVTRNGVVTVLTDRVADTPILYADDLDIAQDGTIYFSDASTKFGAKAYKSTLAASLLEIMEHVGTGRVLAYDPNTQATRIVAGGLVFPNGVAIGPRGADGSESLLVNETGKYRVLKLWVTGPNTGEVEIVLDNLPGFPDNINPGPDGTYLLGLISQRSEWLDNNSARPAARKTAMRLPAWFRPKAVSYGMIIQIDADGTVLKTWQDPSGRYPDTTGAIHASDGYMYVSSLSAKKLARKKLSEPAQ